LACSTQAINVVKNGKVSIQPLGNMEIIKDLVVDLTDFWKKIESIKPWLVSGAEKTEIEKKQTIEEFHKIDAASTCIMCASCFSDCCSEEEDKTYLGPTALAKAQRFVQDSRDEDSRARMQKLSGDTGIWDCTHCGECVERCPTDARPMHRIVELRTEALKNSTADNYGSRHVKGFVKSIKKSGILNENYLPAASMGFTNIPGLLTLLPVGIRMILKGKNPPLIHHSVEEVEDIRRIFNKFEEQK
ncbi:MAG: 4Fe-4S dicluster domain-containing protein, partial [Nitrospinota bacterium]